MGLAALAAGILGVGIASTHEAPPPGAAVLPPSVNAVNIGLAVLLYPSMGVRGLALAWTAAYAVAADVVHGDTGRLATLALHRDRGGGIEGVGPRLHGQPPKRCR